LRPRCTPASPMQTAVGYPRRRASWSRWTATYLWVPLCRSLSRSLSLSRSRSLSLSLSRSLSLTLTPTLTRCLCAGGRRRRARRRGELCAGRRRIPLGGRQAREWAADAGLAPQREPVAAPFRRRRLGRAAWTTGRSRLRRAAAAAPRLAAAARPPSHAPRERRAQPARAARDCGAGGRRRCPRAPHGGPRRASGADRRVLRRGHLALRRGGARPQPGVASQHELRP
jgi:hypothetical protein